MVHRALVATCDNNGGLYIQSQLSNTLLLLFSTSDSKCYWLYEQNYTVGVQKLLLLIIILLLHPYYNSLFKLKESYINSGGYSD